MIHMMRVLLAGLLWSVSLETTFGFSAGLSPSQSGVDRVAKPKATATAAAAAAAAATTTTATSEHLQSKLNNSNSDSDKDADNTNRRSFLIGCSPALLLSFVGVTAMPITVNPLVANAAYGDSVEMEFPSYIEFLLEKNKKVDPSAFLYQGADPEVVLKRLLLVQTKLNEIPLLAQEKKWSQVQGILTGPLGSLGESLNLIAKQTATTTTAATAATPSKKVQAAAKDVKADVIRIGAAATKKDGAECTAGAKQATIDLETFVRIAFE